jgi:hypothetical protein
MAVNDLASAAPLREILRIAGMRPKRFLSRVSTYAKMQNVELPPRSYVAFSRDIKLNRGYALKLDHLYLLATIFDDI